MAKENQDAKVEPESSTAPEATASQDDKQQTAEPSTAGEQQTDQTEETLSSVVEKEAQESLSREAAASAAQKKSSTEEEKPSGEEAPAETAEDKATKEDEVPQEFHEHPAWKRIIGERNEARERVKEIETSAKAYNDLLAYCQRSNVTDEQFQNALELVALFNTDPAAAYDKLRPMVEALETQAGKRIPQDLQTKVDEGLLDPETAQEVARLRAEKELGAKRQASEQQRMQQETVTSMARALNDWEKNKKQTDPDFDRKSELVRGVFLSLYQLSGANGQPLNPIRTPQDAVALAEKALADVNTRIAGFIPAKGDRRVITSQGASTKQTKVVPKSTKEAVSAMLREQHGIDLDGE